MKFPKYLEVRSAFTNQYPLVENRVYFAVRKRGQVEISPMLYYIKHSYTILINGNCAYLSQSQWIAEEPNYNRYIAPEGLL